MNTVTIARKEFADTARSRMLWALMGVFVLLTVGGVVAFNSVFDDFTVVEATQSIADPTLQILPLTALVVGYLAIAGERESGSIRVLLGLPATRRDVMLGKLLGRTGTVLLAVGTAFVAGAVAIFGLYGELKVIDFLLILLLTAVYALVYVGIAVGISAFAKTRGRAMAGAVSVFLVFSVLWNFIPTGIYYLLRGELASAPVPAWFVFVQRLNPTNAFAAAQRFLVTTFGSSSVVSQPGISGGSAQSLSEMIVGEVPFYVEHWFGVVILGIWLLLPVVVGYLRFQSVDIG